MATACHPGQVSAFPPARRFVWGCRGLGILEGGMASSEFPRHSTWLGPSLPPFFHVRRGPVLSRCGNQGYLLVRFLWWGGHSSGVCPEGIGYLVLVYLLPARFSVRDDTCAGKSNQTDSVHGELWSRALLALDSYLSSNAEERNQRGTPIGTGGAGN